MKSPVPFDPVPWTILAVLLLAGCGDGSSPDVEPSEATTPPPPFSLRNVDLGSLQCGGEYADTILEVNGGGLALFDGDGDGDLDVLIVNPGPYPARGTAVGGTNRLYRNDGDWHFTDVTAGSGVDVPRFCNGVAVGDVDSDGDRDLYLTCLGPNVLLRNEGGLRFSVVPEAAGAAGDAWSTSALFIDVERDGDPDLYVVNYLEFDPDDPPLHGQDGRNCTWKGQPVICGPQGLMAQPDRFYRNDDGHFVEAGPAHGLSATPSYGLGVLDGDFNGDGWPDLYVSNDSMGNFLFLSQGDGTLVEAGLISGAAVSARGLEQAGMGLAAGDIEGDGDEDLLVTNFSMEPNALYLNDGDGRFRDVADPAGIGGPSRRLLGWGVALMDVDGDADLDAIAANGHVYRQADADGTDSTYAQADMLLLNDGKGRFSPTAWAGDERLVSRALSVGDLDDDGHLDLIVLPRSGRPRVFAGSGAGVANVQLDLEGPMGNPDVVGAVVEFIDAEGTRTARVRTSAGYQAAGDPRPVFAWRGPGRLVVTFPDGNSMAQPVAAPGRVILDIRR
jgi:hypothetical protein